MWGLLDLAFCMHWVQHLCATPVLCFMYMTVRHLVCTEALLRTITHLELLCIILKDLVTLKYQLHVTVHDLARPLSCAKYVIRKEANKSVGILSHAMVLMDFMCQCMECLSTFLRYQDHTMSMKP